MARINAERAQQFARDAQRIARDVVNHPKVAPAIKKVGLSKLADKVVGQAATSTPVTFEDPSRDTASERNIIVTPTAGAAAAVENDVAHHIRLARKWTLATWINLLLTSMSSLPLMFMCAARTNEMRGSYTYGENFNMATTVVAMIIFSGLTTAYCAFFCGILIHQRKKLFVEQQHDLTSSALLDIRRSLRTSLFLGVPLFVLMLALGSITYAVSYYAFNLLDEDYHVDTYIGSMLLAENVVFALLLITLLLALVFATLALRQVRLASAAPIATTTATIGDAEQDIESEAEKQSMYHVPSEVPYTAQAAGAVTTPAEHIDDGVVYQPPPPPPPAPVCQPTWSVTATPVTITQAVVAPPPRAAPLEAPTMTARANNPLLNSIV